MDLYKLICLWTTVHVLTNATMIQPKRNHCQCDKQKPESENHPRTGWEQLTGGITRETTLLPNKHRCILYFCAYMCVWFNWNWEAHGIADREIFSVKVFRDCPKTQKKFSLTILTDSYIDIVNNSLFGLRLVLWWWLFTGIFNRQTGFKTLNMYWSSRTFIQLTSTYRGFHTTGKLKGESLRSQSYFMRKFFTRNIYRENFPMYGGYAHISLQCGGKITCCNITADGQSVSSQLCVHIQLNTHMYTFLSSQSH